MLHIPIEHADDVNKLYYLDVLGGHLRPGAVSWVRKNGRECPWNATLNEPVPRLIRILGCDWAQKIVLWLSSIVLLSWSSYKQSLTVNSTVRVTCQTSFVLSKLPGCSISWHTHANPLTNCWIVFWVPCGRKFLRVLIFAISPATRKNKFSPIKITANVFSPKSLLQSKYSLTSIRYTKMQYCSTVSVQSQLVSDSETNR